MLRALALLVVAFVAAPALGQDALTQDIYASVENSIRREYDGLMQAIARGEAGGPKTDPEKMSHTLRVMFHNKAVLFASCAAEAERARPPQAPRVPAGANLMLTTCVEEKLAELTRFGNVRSYALIFFPDRIDPCGEASRRRDQEPLFPPYDFLKLSEAKLYDFARYNACLMQPEFTAPAAR
jgi:hypothetical protein